MQIVKQLKTLPILSQAGAALCLIFIGKSLIDLILGISNLDWSKSELISQALIIWLTLLWVLIPVSWLITIFNGRNTHTFLKWIALITVALGLVRTLFNAYALWGSDISIIAIGLVTQAIIFITVWHRGLRG